jgi:hypothetical protein
MAPTFASCLPSARLRRRAVRAAASGSSRRNVAPAGSTSATAGGGTSAGGRCRFRLIRSRSAARSTRKRVPPCARRPTRNALGDRTRTHPVASCKHPDNWCSRGPEASQQPSRPELCDLSVRYCGSFAYVAATIAEDESLPLFPLRYLEDPTTGASPSTSPAKTATRTRSCSAAASPALPKKPSNAHSAPTSATSPHGTGRHPATGWHHARTSDEDTRPSPTVPFFAGV